MVADMSYSTVSNVIDTWEEIRRTENYEEVVGTALFLKFFNLEPEAKIIFGFKDNNDLEDLAKSRRFIKHAKYFIQMIDKALGMLGPDIELLTEILLELGQKHVSYGVRPEYFPSMGRALIHAIQSILDESRFTPDVKDSWVEVYGALSYDMIRAQKL
ncbi:globin-like protein [Nitzschia inconspicua]|uniref:Globin-like protein n=1 Tax=Nitzschia inconspicua TaxID=303405 RepID=A0A9K3PLD8_9STRA|nr:globin-like protein [Nitzschia inconspicua]